MRVKITIFCAGVPGHVQIFSTVDSVASVLEDILKGAKEGLFLSFPGADQATVFNPAHIAHVTIEDVSGKKK